MFMMLPSQRDDIVPTTWQKLGITISRILLAIKNHLFGTAYRVSTRTSKLFKGKLYHMKQEMHRKRESGNQQKITKRD